MKRLLSILIFVLLIGSVNAQQEAVENFLNQGNVDVLVKTTSTIDVLSDGSSPLLDEMTTRLIFKPFDSEQQSISDLNLIHNEGASTAEKDEEIVYVWKDKNTGRLEFGYNAKVRVNNQFPIITNKIKFPIQDLDSNLIQYVKPGEKIVITNEISKKASEIASGDDDLFSVVYKLAKWNNENIEYDLNSLTEKSVQDSQWVLDNRQGVCDEITNLFISMARSLGIPARFISGMVYTNTLFDWGPHGWAEVYFPGIGWVPYDPTFGQYGYIDPGHIKMKNSFDSSEPAIKYTWRSRDIDVETGELDIKVNLLSKGGTFTSPIEIEAQLLKDEVKFNSYVPLRATVKNNNNFYVASTIYVSKAPGLKGDSSISVSLKPKSQKDVYFIIEIPEGEKEFVYTSTIEVKDSFGRLDQDILKYSANFEPYTLEQAESRVERLEENGKDTSLLLLECISDKDEYYEYEQGEFTCKVENDGSRKISNLQVCLEKDCRYLDLGVSQEKELKFLKDGIAEDIFVVAKSSDFVKYSYPDFKFLKIPNIEIKDIEISKPLKYDEIGNLSFFIQPDTIVYNAVINVGNNIGELEIKEFDTGQTIILPFYAFNLKVGSNDVDIKITYEDKNGNKYETIATVNINIEDVNLFKKIALLFRRLVNRI